MDARMNLSSRGQEAGSGSEESYGVGTLSLDAVISPLMKWR